jgi:hypothetical protein
LSGVWLVRPSFSRWRTAADDRPENLFMLSILT